MPARTFANVGLKAGYDIHESGWGADMTLNILKLSVLTQGRVLSKVAAEPGSPAANDVHILDETHATHPNAIAVYDNGAWVYITPLKGWRMFNVATNKFTEFSGTAWGGVGNYRVGFFFTSAPLTSEVLLLHTFSDDVTFADDFAGAVADVGTNPAATFTMDVQRDGVSVGSISISTSGVITFTTTGTTVTFTAGQQMRILGPATEGTAANFSATFKGTIV